MLGNLSCCCCYVVYRKITLWLCLFQISFSSLLLLLLLFWYDAFYWSCSIFIIYTYIYLVRHTPYPTKKHGKKLHHSVSLAVFRYNVKEPYSESERESRKKLSNKQQFDYKRRGIEEVVVDEEKWGGVEENWKEISAIPFFFCLLFCYFCLLLENHSSLILNQHQQQQ